MCNRLCAFLLQADSAEGERTHAEILEQQRRTAVRAHQVQREETRPLDEDGEADRRRHREQGAVERGTNEVLQEVFEEGLVEEGELFVPQVLVEEIDEEGLRQV